MMRYLVVVFICALRLTVNFGLGPSSHAAAPACQFPSNVRCVTTPAIRSVFQRLDQEEECILERFDPSRVIDCSVKSRVWTKRKQSFPSAHVWTRCENCALVKSKSKPNGTDIVAFGDSSPLSPLHIDGSRSQWHNFFFARSNDEFDVSFEDTLSAASLNGNGSVSRALLNKTAYYIGRPVFILPLITVHVGHVLVDFIEQVAHSMVSTYGNIRSDAVILIGCSMDSELDILQEKLTSYIYEDGVNTYRLLDFFSIIPVLATDTLTSIWSVGPDAPIFVKDLHIGFDISRSFINAGSALHPMPIDPQESVFFRRHSEWYQEIQTWVNRKIQLKLNTSDSYSGLLIIQRRDSRRIIDLDRLVRAVTITFGLEPLVVDFDKLALFEQVDYLRRTKILIAMAGTALHNMLFMVQRPAAVIALMQPGWCNRAWRYVNQAALLGIKHFTICANASHTFPRAMKTDSNDNRGNGNVVVDFCSEGWMDGPTSTKFDPIILSTDAVLDVFKEARKHAYLNLQSERGLERELEPRKFPKRNSETNRILDLYAANVTLQQTEDGAYQAGVSLEFLVAPTIANGFEMLFETHPSLCLCILVMSNFKGICNRIDGFNMYAKLNLEFGRPSILLSAWIQTSPKGFKIEGSDVHVVLDSRISESAGFDVVYAGDYFAKSFKQNPLSINLASAGLSKESLEIDAAADGLLHHVVQRSVRDYIERTSLRLDIALDVVDAVARTMFQYVWSNLHSLPPVQTMPSPQQPFVFFHIDKCAGTSIRKMLDVSAKKHGLVSFIPCHGPVACMTYTIPRVCKGMSALPLPSMEALLRGEIALWDDSSYASGCPVEFDRASVIAGHFAWNDVGKVLRQRKEKQALAEVVGVSNDMTQGYEMPTCLLIGRHPVARVISYYYQRCYNTSSCRFYMTRLNDLDVDELRFMLDEYRLASYASDNTSIVMIDEGMSETACRVVLGLRSTTGVLTNVGVATSLPDLIPPELYAEATANADRCVIGLQEDWARTEVVLNHWLPWMDFNRSADEMRIYGNVERPSDLRDELRAAIEDANRCDLHLYEHMRSRFDAMWKHIVGFTYDI